MSATVAKTLDLPLTKTFGRCYAMNSKKVPLINQIKDAQVSLVEFLAKRVKLIVLIVDILTSYGILLSRTFCKDLGVGLKLDWSQGTIPIGGKGVILKLENKSKYIVFPSKDHRSDILYNETNLLIILCSLKRMLQDQKS